MRRLLVLILAAALNPLAAQRSHIGTWASDGYGYVFDIGADTLTMWEVTSVSCIRGMSGVAAPTPRQAVAAYTVTGAPITMKLLAEGQSGLRVHLGFAASDWILRRIDRKPAVCDKPTPNTPLSNFDVFAQSFAEHYPFFAERKVSWAALVAENRAKIADATLDAELFAIMSSMIAPMQDAHTGISARSIGRSARPVRPSPSFVPGAQRASAYALVTRHLAGPLKAYCNGQLEFGMLAPDVAYLRIRTFSNYSREGSFDADTAQLAASLDSIFTGVKAWKGLVIDVRLNTGGADPYGLLIAGRLTDRSYVAYEKQARNDPADPTKWTRPQPSTVVSTSRPGFLGTVIQLIGVQSVSAAETFTQALLSRPNPVIRVGENTQGVFSDVLARTLPNGWSIAVPNERFVTNGKSYDIVGIAPDVPVESLSIAARATQRDAAIEKALELIRK